MLKYDVEFVVRKSYYKLLPNYSALKNSIFRGINISFKTENCFMALGPAD